MNEKRSRYPVLEGIGWLLALSVFVWLILAPPINRYLDANDRIDLASVRINNHIEHLARSKPANKYRSYRAFVAQHDEGELFDSGEMQSTLISLVRTSRARLVDLRVLDENTSIDTLIAYRFRLDVEGDLIAMIDIIEGMAVFKYPIQIDSFNLKPIGNQDRPDRRMSAQIGLSLWMDRPI